MIFHYNRGLTKCNLDDYDGAIEDFSMALNIDPMYGLAYFNRGCIKLLMFGMKDSGCEDLEMAKNLGVEGVEKVIRKYTN
jgi:lipoprotein NlpI